ncbi:PLCD3 [Branchiostoma lanceolatum]|uniref:Phosphoinositide phospholipase C n=1 Tax=Branchiostoma lanceolatum TaxID=7740 RepID=A0A8J9ZA04_BRALA|nr:PLCD3 [Branchiostoma lanceolatum]
MAALGHGVPMDGEACVQAMMNETTMTKLRAGKKKFKRSYRLQKDRETIVYSPTRHSALPECTKRLPAEQAYDVSNILEVFLSTLTSRSSRVDREKAVGPSNCFSISYKDQTPTLDLICTNPETAQTWVRGIQHLIQSRTGETIVNKKERWISEFFHAADKNQNERLDLKEATGLLKRMNVPISSSHIKERFQEVDQNGNGDLDLEEFGQLYRQLTFRQEVEDLFNRVSSPGGTMTMQDLHRFLTQEQKVQADAETCKRIINTYEQIGDVKANDCLSLQGFTLYLESKDGDIYNHAHDQEYQDMTQPLSHYFIASSHNTYLLEDQLRGPSSKEGYIRALQKGSRFLELDCWDGEGGEPVIYHGHTLTSKVLFKEVIEAINDYAFKASPYPVFLSLENHCSVEQQRTMSAHMRRILGSQICTDSDTPDPSVLPSPHSLRGKIIIKNKKLPPDVLEDEVSDEDEAAEIEDPEVQARMQAEKEKRRKELEKKKKKIKLAKELSDLVNVSQAKHFHSFQHSQEKDMACNMSSITENKAMDLVKRQAADFINHTKRQLVKIYPAGGRVDSSNMDPHVFWAAGCQIVAMNYQTPCDQMDLNLGKFRQNGGCGYVLKPEVLRKDYLKIDTSGKIPDKYRKNLTVRVISSFQLPSPSEKSTSSADPYVKVQICGIPADCAEQRTEWKKNSGFHAVWNVAMTFPLALPELAMLRFEVKDHDSMTASDMLGQFALPVDSIQQGYRHVHLLDKRGGDISPASLFVYISLQAP